MSNDDKTALPAFPWDARRPESKFSAYYFFLESTGDPGVDSVLMAVAFAGKMSHSTEQWGDTDVSGRTLGGWIQHAAELAAAAHRAEVERLRAGLRDAFDAGARAAVAEIHGGDDLPANMDITKLPGRPEVQP